MKSIKYFREMLGNNDKRLVKWNWKKIIETYGSLEDKFARDNNFAKEFKCLRDIWLEHLLQCIIITLQRSMFKRYLTCWRVWNWEGWQGRASQRGRAASRRCVCCEVHCQGPSPGPERSEMVEVRGHLKLKHQLPVQDQKSDTGKQKYRVVDYKACSLTWRVTSSLDWLLLIPGI